ncbi:MAG: FxsA family protein [Rubricoccaceae bacterium]
MTRWLFVLFLVVPLLDLSVLVTLGGRLGFWPTVGLVVATALLGAWLARREGLAAVRRVQARLAAGALPGPELIDGLIILFSGALLLTPGFLTDFVGLLGLLPPSRALLRARIGAGLQAGVRTGHIRFFGGAAGSPFGMPSGHASGGPFGERAPSKAPSQSGVYGRPAASSPGAPATDVVDAEFEDAEFEEVPPEPTHGGHGRLS